MNDKDIEGCLNTLAESYRMDPIVLATEFENWMGITFYLIHLSEGGVTLSPICNHEDRNFNNSIEALEYLHQLSVGSNDYPLVHELYSFLWCYRTPPRNVNEIFLL